MYLFSTAEIAQQALNFFPNLKAISDLDIPDAILYDASEQIQFQLCYQCISYQVRFPLQRTAICLESNLKKSVSKKFSPNFYSDNLCRKSNTGHDKKRMGTYKKVKKDIEKDEIKPNNNQINAISKFEYINDQIVRGDSPHSASFESDPIENNPSALLDYWKDSLTPLFGYTKSSPSPSLLTLKSSNHNTFDIQMPENIFGSVVGRRVSGARSSTTTLRSNTLYDNNLYFTDDTSNDLYLSKRYSLLVKRKSISADEALDHYGNSFDENLAFSYFDNWDFYQFREYLESHPIVFFMMIFIIIILEFS